MDNIWPEWEAQLGLGSYGGLDDRHKRRKRKGPLGFAPPKAKPKRSKRPRQVKR